MPRAVLTIMAATCLVLLLATCEVHGAIRVFRQRWQDNSLQNYNWTDCDSGTITPVYSSSLDSSAAPNASFPLRLEYGAECNAWANSCYDAKSEHTILDLTDVANLLPGKSLRVECAYPNVQQFNNLPCTPVVQVQVLKSQKGVATRGQQDMWPAPFTGPCNVTGANINVTTVCDVRMPVLTHACSFAQAGQGQNCTTEMPLENQAAFGGGYLLTVDLNAECKNTGYCQAGGSDFATVVCSVDLK